MDTAEADLLRALLARQSNAALGTLHKGDPAVSMVPFAILPDATGAAIHVSRLATHTRDMLDHPAVALMVTASPDSTDNPLALPRATLRGRAHACEPGSDEYSRVRAIYLAKLPQAEDLFTFPDFTLFVIEPRSLRFVAGFGRAMSLTASQLAEVLTSGQGLPISSSIER